MHVRDWGSGISVMAVHSPETLLVISILINSGKFSCESICCTQDDHTFSIY